MANKEFAGKFVEAETKAWEKAGGVAAKDLGKARSTVAKDLGKAGNAVAKNLGKAARRLGQGT